MESKINLQKGELIEEQLRNYFLNSGYYVARGIKYNYRENAITDIDLFLYGRFSSLSRERINVDIKNKRTPKALERILWTIGLREVLKFEKCIVATTEKKEEIRSFASENSVLLLDGTFLNKLEELPSSRLVEEELIKLLSQFKSYNQFKNKDWGSIYNSSKSKLLNELDFSGFNSDMVLLKYFLGKCYDIQKKEVACRCVYLITSHILIILDYIIKELVFLDADSKGKRLNDGLKFGNLGKLGIEKTIDMAIKISGSNKSVNYIKDLFASLPTDILKEYFSKNENTKNIFNYAKQFEVLGFNRHVVNPNELSIELKSLLGLFIDYSELNRKKIYEMFSPSLEGTTDRLV